MSGRSDVNRGLIRLLWICLLLVYTGAMIHIFSNFELLGLATIASIVAGTFTFFTEDTRKSIHKTIENWLVTIDNGKFGSLLAAGFLLVSMLPFIVTTVSLDGRADTKSRMVTVFDCLDHIKGDTRCNDNPRATSFTTAGAITSMYYLDIGKLWAGRQKYIDTEGLGAVRYDIPIFSPLKLSLPKAVLHDRKLVLIRPPIEHVERIHLDAFELTNEKSTKSSELYIEVTDEGVAKGREVKFGPIPYEGQLIVVGLAEHLDIPADMRNEWKGEIDDRVGVNKWSAADGVRVWALVKRLWSNPGNRSGEVLRIDFQGKSRVKVAFNKNGLGDGDFFGSHNEIGEVEFDASQPGLLSELVFQRRLQ